MGAKKFSLNNVILTSISSFNGRCLKIFASTTIQYFAFLLVYILTNSLLLSFTVYALFLPSQIKFLTNLDSEKLEDVFKIGKKFTGVLLIAMLFVAVFGIGFVLFVAPAVIFFINYALVFDVAKDGELGVIDSFKEAKKRVVGYRGQMTLLFFAFLLIMILFMGFFVLLGWLFSLFIPLLNAGTTFILPFINLPMFVYLGLFAGVSAFLVFVLPVELVALSNMTGEIEQDKLYKSLQEKNEKVESAIVEAKEQENATNIETEKEDISYEDVGDEQKTDKLIF